MGYPGHCDLMKFLLHDLQMQDDQEGLGRIFEKALPATFQDQIVIFVSATGQYRGRLAERTYAKTIYHQTSTVRTGAASRSPPPRASARSSTCCKRANCPTRAS